MRGCPACKHHTRTEVFNTQYCVPDNWPIPAQIHWFVCENCAMLYGDGDFDQAMLNRYYKEYYGYGVNGPENIERLSIDSMVIETLCQYRKDAAILDFGGRGDDSRSVIVDGLQARGYKNVHCLGPGDRLFGNYNVIYASHVLEHIYDLPETFRSLVEVLNPDGTLMVDVPDSMGLLLKWNMPQLDFNTKHINHFTLYNLLDLGKRRGLEAIHHRSYTLDGAPAFQVWFKKTNLAQGSAAHVMEHVRQKVEKVKAIDFPVNVWGLNDLAWNVLGQVENLQVLDYIDNDPAYRGRTYKGKPVLERPTNDEPIVIIAQSQGQRLVENIKRWGLRNRVVVI